jgi:hypothetical protein
MAYTKKHPFNNILFPIVEDNNNATMRNVFKQYELNRLKFDKVPKKKKVLSNKQKFVLKQKFSKRLQKLERQSQYIKDHLNLLNRLEKLHSFAYKQKLVLKLKIEKRVNELRRILRGVNNGTYTKPYTVKKKTRPSKRPSKSALVKRTTIQSRSKK